MVVGLGHGSTARFALEELARRLESGKLADIRGVPCSREVEEHARRLGLPLTDLSASPAIDLTIDGADEVDPSLDLIKGGGGALLREKIVAQASRRELIVVDESKLSSTLGSSTPLPVEVVRFGAEPAKRLLQGLGGVVSLRRGPDGACVLTEEGNWILDCELPGIADPYALAARLDEHAAVAAHGLFLGLASEVFVGDSAGVRSLRPASSS
jgi:ribose 5-phosphate isomerase A